MSNPETIDSDKSSDTESFYSHLNSSKTSVTKNSKKRPRPLNNSTSSSSPSPTVQKSIPKLLKQGETDFSTLTFNEMDEGMKNVFKNLILKSEERIKSEITDVRKDMADFKTEVMGQIGFINSEAQLMKIEFSKVTSQLRKKNLVIQGLREKKQESWKDLEVAIDELYKKLGIPVKPDYDDCFRLGKPNVGKVRPVLLKLIRLRDKKLIMSLTKNLKGSNIFV
jgi:hypothetical protein